MTTSAFDEAFEKVKNLAEAFQAHEDRYCSSDYKEADVRLDFIDPFLDALGWKRSQNPYQQELKVEQHAHSGTQGRADYAFYIAPRWSDGDVRFFLEAKKPHDNIATAGNYLQTISYGYSSRRPLAVLTDFEQFHILDCRYEPKLKTALEHCVDKFDYRDYLDRDKFGKIYWLFSREAFTSGSFDAYVKQLRGKKTARAPKAVDESLLERLDELRNALAHSFKNNNPELDSEALTEFAQRTLDRLVFLRFLEDKGIERQGAVNKLAGSATAWRDFIASCRQLDSIYNGIIYRHQPTLDAPTFRMDNAAFADVCKRLAHGDTDYNFNFDFIPIHILGSIYERFLGKVIVATDKRVRVEEKPEVRKAGGVYYTPDYIVHYIVENTVGKLIAGKTPDQIAKMRFADIACGSGSFLLGVYDLLLTYHGSWYNANRSKARKGDCFEHDGKLYLSLAKKRDILLKNIYGVDIDAQAVEVCQLSLCLKLLKDESPETTAQYLLDFEHTAQMKKLLPDLSKNIVCGNSLIGRDIVDGQLFASDEERKLNPMDFEDAFPHVFKRRAGMVRETPDEYSVAHSLGREGGRRVYPSPLMETRGFDAIVGNPPYRMLQPHNTTPNVLAYLRSHYVAAEFKIDLFHLFLQRAASLLKDGGQLGYIVPTTILNNVYAEKLRGWLMDHCRIEQIAVARGRVFAEADVHTSVLVFRREASDAKREDQEVLTTDQLSPEFAATPSFVSRTRQATFASLPGHVWNILVNDKNSLLIRRLTTGCEPLEKVAIINRGLITGDRDKYFAKTKKSAQHVPILAGSDVHRYHAARPSEFVLFKRPKTAGGCWDEEVHFAPHKLVVRQICEEPTASILRTPLAVTGNIFTARADSVETELYLLGIINSRLTGFFWRTMFADFKTSFPQVTIFSLAQVPICLLDLSDSAEKARRDEMVTRVEAMLEAKKQLAKARSDKDKTYYENKCAALDRQIDLLVYVLYGLTEEEIKTVERAN